MVSEPYGLISSIVAKRNQTYSPNLSSMLKLNIIKFSSKNYLLSRSQVLLMIQRVSLEHHLTNSELWPKTIKEGEKETTNQEFTTWLNNDVFAENMADGDDDGRYAGLSYWMRSCKWVWFTIKEQMLPVTKKKQETWLKDNLYWLKKESSGLEEFL